MGRSCHCPDCRYDRVGDKDCCALEEYEKMEKRIEELERDLAEVARWYQTALKRIAELERIIARQTTRWGKLVDWYETADRSAHSWAELDRIMNEEEQAE